MRLTEYGIWLTEPIYGESIKIQTESESFYLWWRDNTLYNMVIKIIFHCYGVTMVHINFIHGYMQ